MMFRIYLKNILINYLKTNNFPLDMFLSKSKSDLMLRTIK